MEHCRNNKADLILRNGRVLDASVGLDNVCDIAVFRGRMTPLSAGMRAETEIDASGCIITPGLIDFHCHLFDLGSDSGIPVDLAMLPNGVTAAVDCGSSGVSTYRAFLQQLSLCKTPVRLFLQMNPSGQTTHQYPEPQWPDTWSEDRFRQAFEVGGERVLGLKLRISRPLVGERGKDIFDRAMEMAQRLECRINIHVTDPCVPLSYVADHLRKGDVFCHVFHGTGETLLDSQGRVLEAVWKAKQRGVVMDACHGKANHCFDVAEKAIAQGFLPDTISTDITTRTWNKPPVYSLPHVLSKFLHSGMSLGEVFACATATPARLIGMEGEAGTLAPGARGDIAIFKLVEQSVTFQDSVGGVRQGGRLLVPQAVIQGGVIVCRAPTFLD